MRLGRDVVEKAKSAATRVDDWDGADHFEDCPALFHECHDCSCPDTDEGEEECDRLKETSCDCYLGAMRNCRESIRALLSDWERLRELIVEWYGEDLQSEKRDQEVTEVLATEARAIREEQGV